MEVIVAIAIMTIVATAAASVSINGVATSQAEERQQVAITVANSAMESVSGWSVAMNTTTGVSNLYTGRGKAAVSTAFAANSTRPGVAQTNQEYDHSLVSTSTSNGTLPIVNTPPAQDGTIYTVTTLIGSCYQLTTVQTSGSVNNSASE